MSYAFRPLTADDLPMLHLWMQEPEVRAWWGDPDFETELLREDLANPLTAKWVVEHAGRPFAYIQDYDLRHWWPHAFGQPEGARFIDQFVGVPEMIGVGHGSAFIRQHVDGLLAAGAPVVGVDPDPENGRAIRAYAKAGFTPTEVVKDSEGYDVLLMLRFPNG